MGAAALCIVAAQWASVAFAATDVEMLRALHEKVMLAHRQSKVELLLEDEAADYVVAGRGEITHPSLADRKERLGSYLGAHQVRGVPRPDRAGRHGFGGRLRWAGSWFRWKDRGVQTTKEGQKEPLEFVSAWIELYRKQEGRWLRVGNVSNFKP